MKKAILKIFGVAALAAGMIYNVQVSDVVSVSDISLAALGNVAAAQSEGGAPGPGCVLLWDGWDFVESCPDDGGNYPGFYMEFDHEQLLLICRSGGNSTCNVHDQG